jgi:hypothetical protein
VGEPGQWRLSPVGVFDGREFSALIDPHGAEVLRHWYVPLLRRCVGRLGSRARLSADMVRGICRAEASFPIEFSAAYRDDFDNPEAASAAE